MIREENTDVLVIGSGIAGIRAAIEVHEQGLDVILTTKGALCKDGASSWMAGNGFQAALYHPDSVDVHIEDTIRGGKFLNNQQLVRTFLSKGSEVVEDLYGWGVRFSRRKKKYYQIAFPGHTHPRSLVGKPGLFMGPEYRKAMFRQVKERKIRAHEDMFLVDLLLTDDRVVGAIGLDLRTGEIKYYRAKSTILATGGFMGCYQLTTANQTATGDGHGLAYRAGAKMVNMEMIQFLPAATLWPKTVYGDPYPYLLWVSLHPVFYNNLGERFLQRYYPEVGDWATREAAARAIAKEVRAGRGSPHGGAYMSFRHLPRNLVEGFLEKASGVDYLQKLKDAQIDIRYDGIEVAPGAHYVAGGCWINERCETTLEGLYAVGEVGSGGKDGADRLGGNSIPFCLAMGSIAGQEASKKAKNRKPSKPDSLEIEKKCRRIRYPMERTGGKRPIEMKTAIREVMSNYAYVERTGNDLEIGIEELHRIRERDLPLMATGAKNTIFNRDWQDALETLNMLDSAEMVCRAALMRQESRGLHQRSDYPDSKPDWLKHIMIEKSEEEMKLSTRPLEFPIIKPPEEASNHGP
jgi:succinate dehydrogenase/fumarate reductase flavoprotein subunit